MKLRIIPMAAYDGCIPVTVYCNSQREFWAQRTASLRLCAMVVVAQSATHGLYGRKVTTEKQP